MNANSPMVPGYTVLHSIGSGGMSVVFAAQNARGVQVALKVSHLDDAEGEAQFVREVRINRRLRHPGIAKMLDAGLGGNRAWIAFEYLEGQDLALRQRDLTFSFQQRLAVLKECARALAHVHAQGIVHCDVSPNNIFLTAHGPKLLDFGIAQGLDEICNTRVVSGTARYIAPERIRADVYDARSDVFSFASVAFELLSGSAPWEAPNTCALLWAKLERPAKTFEEAARTSRVPIPSRMIDPLGQVLRKALARDPMERTPSMESFALALASLNAGPARLPPPRVMAAGAAA